MIKLVIFDLDGTLLNTVEDLANATNYALERQNIAKHEVEKYKIFCGRGIYNLFKAALPDNRQDEQSLKRTEEYFLEYYNTHQNEYTKEYEGVSKYLKALSDNGIHLAVASNKYQEGVEQLVKHYFPDIKFIKVLGQRKGKAIKPNPEIIEEIAKEVADINKDEIIYCGDSDVDMQTGLNAKVKTIGVSWGFRTIEELSAYPIYKIVHTMKELYESIISA